MTYSCGIFEDGAATLEQAQIEKIDRACRKLDLGPDDHLLEIGTGWGALAIHARWGNWLATTLLRWLYDYRFTDLGPRGLRPRARGLHPSPGNR